MLMGCGERQVREVFESIVKAIKNPYGGKKLTPRPRPRVAESDQKKLFKGAVAGPNGDHYIPAVVHKSATFGPIF